MKPVSAIVAAILLLSPIAAIATERKATPPPPGTALVTVNGKAVTPELYAAFRRASQNGGKEDDGHAASQLQILNQLVNFILLSQDAEKRGLERNPLVAARIDVARTQVLASAAIADFLSRTAIPEQELKQAYGKRFSGVPIEEYRIRHILVDDEQTAKALIERLRQGEEFTALMRPFQADARAGDLGWMSPGQMEPAIERAMATLEPGHFAPEPVKTDFGWHVIELLEKRRIPQPSFGEMRAGLLQEAQQKRLTEYIRSLRSKADLDVKKAAVGGGVGAPRGDARETGE